MYLFNWYTHTPTHSHCKPFFSPKSVSFFTICSAFFSHHCLSWVGIGDKAVSFSVATTKLHFLRKSVKKNPKKRLVLEAWLPPERIWLLCLMECDKNRLFFVCPLWLPRVGLIFLKHKLRVWKESVLEFSCQMHFVLWKGTRTLLRNPGENAPFWLVYLLFLGRGLIALAILHIGHKHLDSSINWLDFRGRGWNCSMSGMHKCHTYFHSVPDVN